jgi:hypothetical protein
VDIRADTAIAAEAGVATVEEADAATEAEILAMADEDSRVISTDKPAEVEVSEAGSPDTAVATATAAVGLALVLDTPTPPDRTGVAITGTPTRIPTTITTMVTGRRTTHRRTTRVQEWPWVSSGEVMGLVGGLLVEVDGAVSDGKIAPGN